MAAILCGRCGALTTKEAARCDRCGRRWPGLFGLRPLLDRMFPLQAPFARTIVLALVVVHFAMVLAAQRTGDVGEGFLGRFSPGTRTFLQWGALIPFDLVRATGEWFRYVTAILLHGNPVHLLFNGWAILQLGNAIAYLYGPARLVVLFVIAGIGGFVASAAWDPSRLTLGASGSAFGLLGALLAYGRRRGGTAGAHIRQMAIQWILIGLAYGFFMPGVDNAAHVGGVATGFLLAWTFDAHRLQRGRESDGAKVAAFACLLLVAACAIWCAVVAVTRG